jgi:hypothetical protein
MNETISVVQSYFRDHCMKIRQRRARDVGL